MSSIITVSDINKYYAENGIHKRKTHVLKDISLTIRRGEFFVILGPSGSGKSTLLRIMTRLEKADFGTVMYENERETGVPVEQDIGFVFQQFAILPWLTVSENIELNLIGRKVPPARRKEIVETQLREFRLEKFASAYPRQLSGGMKQRVGLARAFATDAKIIFLDEPFSELDLFTSEELRGELLRMWQGGTREDSASANAHAGNVLSENAHTENAHLEKKTVVMISHNITEAIELADRIAVLSSRPGEIRQIVENPLPRPRQQRTPEFFALEDKLYNLLKQEKQ